MCSIPKQLKTEVRDKIADRGTLWQNEGSVPHNGERLHRGGSRIFGREARSMNVAECMRAECTNIFSMYTLQFTQKELLVWLGRIQKLGEGGGGGGGGGL